MHFLAYRVPVAMRQMSSDARCSAWRLTHRSPRLIAMILVASLGATTGCTVWRKPPSPTLPTPAPKEVRVWSRDSAITVRAPAIRGDTLIGTRTNGEAVELVKWPIKQVDSLQVSRVSPGRTALAVIGVAGSLFVILASQLSFQ